MYMIDKIQHFSTTMASNRKDYILTLWKAIFIRPSLPFGLLVFVFVISLTSCATNGIEYQYLALRRSNNIDQYERFIKEHPNSVYNREIEERLSLLKEEKAFNEAEEQNTKRAYANFVEKYPTPHTSYGIKAKYILEENEDKAFRRTSRLDKVQALLGFLESYPDNKYSSLIRQRIEYINATKKKDTPTFYKFISEYPDNPFIYEAKCSIPLIFLEEFKKKQIGILVDVDSIVPWKGIFSGGNVTMDDVRKEVFKDYKKKLEALNIETVLLSDRNEPRNDNILAVLSITYREKKGPMQTYSTPSSRSSGPGLKRYMIDSLNKGAADNLANTLNSFIFGDTFVTSISMSLSDSNNQYYTRFFQFDSLAEDNQIPLAMAYFGRNAVPALIYNMNSKDYHTRINSVKILGSIKDKAAVHPLLVALKDKDEEEDIRLDVAKALGNITGEDFSEQLESVTISSNVGKAERKNIEIPSTDESTSKSNDTLQRINHDNATTSTGQKKMQDFAVSSESLTEPSRVTPLPVPVPSVSETADSMISTDPKTANALGITQAEALPVKRYPALSEKSSLLEAPTFPPKGTKYSYAVKRLGKKWTDKYVVIGEGVHDGRRVHQVKLEGKDGQVLYDIETGNWMRTEIEGSTVGSAQPYEDIFRYPLEVGKKHRSEFYYFDHVTTGNTKATVNVVSFKDIKVPAGTFKAYQIVAWESSAISGASYGSTWWRKKTLWYSPDLKIVVKMVDTNQPDSHTTTTELLEYIEP